MTNNNEYMTRVENTRLPPKAQIAYYKWRQLQGRIKRMKADFVAMTARIEALERAKHE
jgi:hypothetical protein